MVTANLIIPMILRWITAGMYMLLIAEITASRNFQQMAHTWGNGGNPGSGNGQFNGLFYIAIDSSDIVYVSDSGNNRT